MSAGRICARVVATALPSETIVDAARRMEEIHVGTLVIVEPGEGSALVGILTDRDIVTRCVAAGRDPEETRISTLMTAPVHSVDEATPLEEAVELMATGGTRRLVVTGERGRPVGMLSLDDLMVTVAGELHNVRRILEAQRPSIAV